MRILEAVSFLHSSGVVHGDIKLSNIMVKSCDDVRVVDFGSSSVVDSQDGRVSAFRGTPLYMAPEIARQRLFDGRRHEATRLTCGRSEWCFTACSRARTRSKCAGTRDSTGPWLTASSGFRRTCLPSTSK